MRLAISNIAWDVVEDEEIAALLQNFGIDAIDVAPGKYFSDPVMASAYDVTYVRRWWEKRGIEIVGMQALLFGTTGLNMFGPTATQSAMLKQLEAVCRIGAGLGATRLVFGSPRNRDRSGLTDQEALDVAMPFFRRLGNIAERRGVSICVEPTPTCYNANFLTTSAETARFVRQLSHPAIKMQLDTGALTVSREDLSSLLEVNAELVGHIHASEPALLPLGDGDTDHPKMHEILMRHIPNHLVSVEMVATENEPHHESITRALGVAIRSYRAGAVGVKS